MGNWSLTHVCPEVIDLNLLATQAFVTEQIIFTTRLQLLIFQNVNFTENVNMLNIEIRFVHFLILYTHVISHFQFNTIKNGGVIFTHFNKA